MNQYWLVHVGTTFLLTVQSLRIRRGLSLLRLVPIDNETIPKRECCPLIRCRLVTIEQRTCQGRLDVTNGFFLKIIFVGKWLG